MGSVKSARICFSIASFSFVFIGALHVIVHFGDLSTMELDSALLSLGEVNVFGQVARVRDMWQAFSILMGAAFIALGSVNLASMFGQPKRAYPNSLICLINTLMLMVVTLMGYLHLGPMQLIGGPIGIILFGLCIYWAKKNKA